MNRTNTTHPCPIPGCRATWLRYAMLMCRLHWNMLPRSMQDAVYLNWNDAHPTAEYLVWRAAAIAHVAKQEAGQ